MKMMSWMIGATLIACETTCAGMLTGQTYTVGQESQISVEFLRSNAGATGSLYFLGFESAAGSLNYAISTDTANLGRRLFSNHGTPAGTSTDLGAFVAGDTLHFAYLITRGVGSVAPTGMIFRSDLASDLLYFARSDASLLSGPSLQTTLSIEDIRDPGRSDFDYNDVVFQVTETPVPEPGQMSLAMAGIGLATVRRRRV